MVNRVSRPRARKKKQKRQAASDDDDVDWVQFIPNLIAGGAALYNAHKKNKAKDFDIGSTPQMGAYQDRIDDYQSNLNDYRGIAEDYMDPEGEMATMMSKQIGGDSMNQIALQNQLNNRNPFTSSGITQTQNQGNTISGITGANKNIAQMLMQLKQQGTGMMGGAMGMQGNLVGQQGGIANMFAQQHITNRHQQNLENKEQAGQMGEFGMGLLNSGLEGLMG